jgi:Predicted oxidoreductases (related to aryl-alcohol dehydrogenases)
MKYMKIGAIQDASVISLGTWAIGGGQWWGDSDENESAQTIKTAVDCGINLIDTAPAYGKGLSEMVLGKALKGIRNKVYISTKCGLVWDVKEGSFFFEKDGKKILKNLSPASIQREAENSLRRLQTDHIDIYFTHWQSVPPFFTPIAETMEALQKLKKEGKILAIGASNVSVGNLKEYVACGGLDIIQNKYSLLDRTAEKEFFDVLKQNGVAFQAYSPLEMGLLTGTIHRDFVPAPGSAREGKKWFEKENMLHVVDIMEGWRDLLQKYNCTFTHLAIAWLRAQGDFVNVLCGARKVFQLKDNIGGGDIVLEAQDVARIRNDVERLG